MEYCQYDIKDIMKKDAISGREELSLHTIIYNLLCAVKFIHSANVMHRDLKPENVLITSDCHIQICDFGLSRCIENLGYEKVS